MANIIILLYVLLLIPKASRFGAFVLIIETIIYYLFIKELPGEYYYSACAFLAAITAFVLSKTYLLTSVLLFSLISVNFFGWVLYENYYDPDLYDIIYAIITVAIALSIIPRGLINGVYNRIGALFIKYTLVRPTNSNGCEQGEILHKSKKGKKA